MGAPLTISRHKLSIDDYHKMGDVGILREDSRVELIDGELIELSPIGSSHVWIVNRISTLFVRQVDDNAIVSVQNPIALSKHSELQPDLAVVKAKTSYRSPLPTAEDVLLLVEVADTSLGYDRDTKIPIYSQHGVPEVWLLDVQNEELIVHLSPTPDGYQKRRPAKKNEVISPSLLPLVKVRVSDIWR